VNDKVSRHNLHALACGKSSFRRRAEGLKGSPYCGVVSTSAGISFFTRQLDCSLRSVRAQAADQ
jgi:hypothetical protein